MRPYRIIISGGGTGGHIFPAISIANECRRRWPDCEILFVGAQDRMEMEKVPAAGYKIEGLWISGLQRKLSARNLMFPVKVIKSLMDARRIVRSFQPDIVIGTGGYASGPVLFMANRAGIPTLIQEQNSYAGITNKLLSKKVNKICVASNQMDRFFPSDKIVFTGNPVRQDLIKRDVDPGDARRHFGFHDQRKTVLVLGGSLGARKINQLIADQLPLLSESVNVIWQCGKLYYDKYSAYESSGVKVQAFLSDMAYAYSAADFIISRAGAGTISELALVGKPTLFIPSPHVAEDHQTQNALAIQSANAAMMVRESELDENFPVLWKELISNRELQERLSTNFLKMARPQATSDIVDQIETLLNA